MRIDWSLINQATSCGIYLPDSFVREEEQLEGQDFLTLMLPCKTKSKRLVIIAKCGSGKECRIPTRQ